MNEESTRAHINVIQPIHGDIVKYHAIVGLTIPTLHNLAFSSGELSKWKGVPSSNPCEVIGNHNHKNEMKS